MSAKTIADVLDLGSRYSENGINDYIAYRYSDLKKALIELVKSTQNRSNDLSGVEVDYVGVTNSLVPEDFVQNLHDKVDDVFADLDDNIEVVDALEIEIDPEAKPLTNPYGGNPGPYDHLWTSFWEQKP